MCPLRRRFHYIFSLIQKAPGAKAKQLRQRILRTVDNIYDVAEKVRK
jgi:hypothetical protein